MRKKTLCIVFLIAALNSFSQQLFYGKNGSVKNNLGGTMSPKNVREEFSSNSAILDLYNAGRTKKSVGNVLLIGGAGLLLADLIHGATASDIQVTDSGIEDKVVYPSALTYLGLASVLIAIPVKSGYSKKIKTAVDRYNAFVSQKAQASYFDEIKIMANANGVGLKFVF